MDRDKLSYLMKKAQVFVTGLAEGVSDETVVKELEAMLLALETHKSSADHDGDAHDWTNLNRFLQAVPVAGLLAIGAMADIGSSTNPFRKGWISELTSLILRKGNVLVMDGLFVITKQSGKFAVDVAAGDTRIDFGQALTVGDYLLLQAENKVEYMRVGSLVEETTYNVTRDLDGSGANDWPRESVYFVRGHQGDGWIELSAVDEQRISNFTQGANWNQWLEDIRLGEIDGWQASPFAGNGFAMGNYVANKYLVYTDNNGLIINGSKIYAGNGNVIIDENGISVLMTNGWADLSRLLKFGDPQMPNRFLIGGAKEQFDGTIALIKAQAPTGKRADLNLQSISDKLSWINISADCGDKTCGISGYANSNAMGPNSVINIKGEEVQINNNLVSPVPGANRIMQAGPDGKADAGWVPAPNYCAVKRTNALSVANNSWVTVSWNSADANNAGMWVSGNPTTITIKKAGFYRVEAAVAFAVNGNGIRSASLRVNGIEIARTNEVPNSTMQATILVSTERAFNVNDKITLVIFQNSGGSLGIHTGYGFKLFVRELVGVS